MQPLRIGFVGLGGICRERHVPGLRRIPGVKLVAVANRSWASGEAAAREFDLPEVCASWQELVDRSDLDAVFVGTWPYQHHPVSIAALQAGKHVFCQARMAMDYSEAREMYEAALVSGKVAALCPAPFGLSVDRSIARLLQDEGLGDVHLVRVQGLSPANIDPKAPMHWRKDHRLSGLNMLTLGLYIEVIHRWFGWTRTVTAQTQIFTPWRRDATDDLTEVRIPDQLLFNADMDRGVVVQYIISGMVANGRDTIEIHGTKASLLYDVGEDRLYTLQPGESPKPVEIAPEDAYDVKQWRVEQDFVDAIRLGTPYRPNFEDGLRYMQVIQAVHDSAMRQQTIQIE